MSTYSANGCGHRILTLLDRGGICTEQLFQAASSTPRERRDAKYILRAMRADGLVVLVGDVYEVTTIGQRALAELGQSGFTVGPSRRGGRSADAPRFGQAVPSDPDHSLDRPRRDMPAFSTIAAESAPPSVRVFGARAAA